MEFWPADFRTDVVSSSSTKKRRKGKAAYANEQSLETGSLGSATLTSERESSQWVTAVQPRRKHIPRAVGKSLEFFPSTKSQPLNLPKLSVHQRAEQGARFLRTYHPDVDIPFELIKDELQSDDEEAAADAALDPFAGNRLAHSSLESKRNQITHFLAFPSGETGTDLNVSPFCVKRDNKVVFCPSATPTSSFNTPIQQVVAFSSRSDNTHPFSLLAVRTHSAVSVVRLQDISAAHLNNPSLTAATIIPIPLTDTGGHRVVDVSGTLFSSSNAQGLLVNDLGSVYNCKIDENEKMMVLAPDAWGSDLHEPDQFWRVARRDLNTGMRSSSKRVQLFDLRASTTPSLVLFDLNKEKEFLTSIEAPMGGRHMMCFSTTTKLVWIDERNQKGPVLSINHQRAFDRTLRVETVHFGHSLLTMLSSSSNRLTTVYDVNRGPSGLTYLHGEPTMLSGSPLADLPLAGSIFFRHSADEESAFGMFQLSCRGSLWKTKVVFSEDADDAVIQDPLEALEWTADVHTLAAQAKTMSEVISPLGGREYLDVNLRETYEKIFQMPPIASETSEADAEAVYQTLERMPFFWQDMAGPAEHMLLTFDVAFQSGREPSNASRADFLTESLLSSPQGFVALTRDRVPIPRLTSTARWHHDLKSLPSHMVPDITTRSQSLIDQQREIALADAATAEGMKRAIDATQHLALDLALSRHVYAPQFFSKPRAVSSSDLDESNLLSQATQAMSLGATEPAPVEFGYLRPMSRTPIEQDEQMESAEEPKNVGVELPLGIRLLLSQWEIGTDPQKYAYKDPYDEPDAETSPKKPALGRRPDLTSDDLTHYRAMVPPIVSVQRAPPVVVSTSRPMATTGPIGRTASLFELNTVGLSHISDTFANDKRPTSSQEVYQESTRTFSSQQQPGPSTQPLPGAFGGGTRQKNKAGKKRMGGF